MKILDKVGLFIASGGSGDPNSPKIKCLSNVAVQKGIEYILPDWRYLPCDPEPRLKDLEERTDQKFESLVLAGSSLGGYVCSVYAHKRKVDGLFLLTPILGKDGYKDDSPKPMSEDTVIIAASEDEYTNAKDVIAFAKTINASLHLLSGNHSLENHSEFIAREFGAFIDRIKSRKTF
ncbi:MAG: hypothetical protein AB3N64_08575 [Puniceicoccaceae bacterium]